MYMQCRILQRPIQNIILWIEIDCSVIRVTGSWYVFYVTMTFAFLLTMGAQMINIKVTRIP